MNNPNIVFDLNIFS